jgi:hypothetical protein
MGQQPAVLGDESHSMLDRGRIDQSICGIAGKGWQRHRGLGDGGSDAEFEAAGMVQRQVTGTISEQSS